MPCKWSKYSSRLWAPPLKQHIIWVTMIASWQMRKQTTWHNGKPSTQSHKTLVQYWQQSLALCTYYTFNSVCIMRNYLLTAETSHWRNWRGNSGWRYHTLLLFTCNFMALWLMVLVLHGFKKVVLWFYSIGSNLFKHVGTRGYLDNWNIQIAEVCQKASL